MKSRFEHLKNFFGGQPTSILTDTPEYSLVKQRVLSTQDEMTDIPDPLQHPENNFPQKWGTQPWVRQYKDKTQAGSVL